MSSISNIFASPFKLTGFREFSQHSEGFKAIYKTQEVHGETTKQEVYVLSKMYFDNIVKRYENYVVNNKPITETSFRLYVKLIEDDDLAEKHIYSVYYNNIENRISWENKYDDNFTIEGDFTIILEVIGHVIDDYDDGDHDTDDEDYDAPGPCKKAISKTECIICFEKTPNILYLECLHKCVCDCCDDKGKFVKCPLCRTRIKNNKIKII